MKKIVTVLGEITPQELGITMAHEHVICDISKSSGEEDNLLNDITLAVNEVAFFKEAGGCTIVDLTPADIGRDPVALRKVSEASGVNIITTTGFYSERAYPAFVYEKSTAELAAQMVREASQGIGETGIRCGVIGELGSNQPYVTPAEERVLRAAARAHNETGLAIALHSSYDRPAPRQLAVLQEEGVSSDRVIVSHADLVWHEDIAKDMDYFQLLLDNGCYLGFDTIGWDDFSPERERVKRIAALVEIGYAGQLLLSSDLCRRSFYHKHGGRGYDYVLLSFIPRLREHGISADDINRMLVENPREVFSS